MTVINHLEENADHVFRNHNVSLSLFPEAAAQIPSMEDRMIAAEERQAHIQQTLMLMEKVRQIVSEWAAEGCGLNTIVLKLNEAGYQRRTGSGLLSGGFLNTVRTNFLKKLYAYAPEAAYFHKGDLDPYGFLILENLKKKTGIPFCAMEMDLDTLRRCHRAGHFRNLDAADRKIIDSEGLAEY